MLVVGFPGIGVAADTHRRHPPAGVVAAWALHLDHVGTEVGQQHGGERYSEDAGEVGDQEAVEWWHESPPEAVVAAECDVVGSRQPLSVRPTHRRMFTWRST